jgi:hypothetical protein
MGTVAKRVTWIVAWHLVSSATPVIGQSSTVDRRSPAGAVVDAASALSVHALPTSLGPSSEPLEEVWPTQARPPGSSESSALEKVMTGMWVGAVVGTGAALVLSGTDCFEVGCPEKEPVFVAGVLGGVAVGALGGLIAVLVN